MDLMYMSDVMAYQTVRNPLYDKDSWDPPTKNNETKAQGVHKSKSNKPKTPCKICQEKQRRSLLKYIRSKSHDHSEENIEEEQEEEEKEEEEKEEAEKKEQTVGEPHANKELREETKR